MSSSVLVAQPSKASGSGADGARASSVALPMSGLQSMQSSPASGAQIRSRITVVCAECKRLKLKCDRRAPCGSCIKRDTVSRCHYSAAAAEKIDVQSLHNRVLLLEAHMTAVQSNPAILSYATRGTHASYDRALLAVGQSGSSLTISLDDIAVIWLDELDLTKDGIELRPATHTGSSYKTNTSTGLDMLDILLNYAPFFRIMSTTNSSSGSSSLSKDVGVTPELVACLPTEPLRSQLLDQLEAALIMHPCVNFPHFRSLVANMFRWAENTSGMGSAESSTGHRPTLSFFAAATASFSLGAQCYLEARGAMTTADHSSSTIETKPPVSTSAGSRDNLLGSSEFTSELPHTLNSLATFTLELHLEHHSYAAYDLDYLHAMIMKALYLLHASPGPGLPHELFPLIGKMVNAARMMGLAIDPDELDSPAPGPLQIKREEGASKLSLFEKEMRRRLWWDVFSYDLFISDFMDLPPLISDETHTTRFPTDVDEALFGPHSTMLPPPNDENRHGNIAFLIQKCRLARLVKSMKKRSFREPGLSNNDLSIDQAAIFDEEVQQWLKDLPDKFKLNMDLNWSNLDPLPLSSVSHVASSIPPQPTNVERENEVSSTATSQSDTTVIGSSSDTPFLIAQRCELACISNRLLLKLYLPFLKNARANNGVQLKPPQQAILATVNAAHTIVHTSRVLHAVLRETHPAIYMFYSYARTLFDAAVICAHNTIQQPHSIYARIAMEDVRASLLVLSDPMVSTGRGPVLGGVEGSPSEAVKIVELLKTRAEAAMSGSGIGVNAGTKRKHAEVDVSSLTTYKGFHLPFVGGGVVNAGPRQSYIPPITVPDSEVSSSSRTTIVTHRGSGSGSNQGPRDQTRAKHERDGNTRSVGKSETAASSGGGKVITQKERPSKAQATVHYPSIGIRVRSGSIRNETDTPKSRRNSTASRSSGTPLVPHESSMATIPPSVTASTEPSPTYQMSAAASLRDESVHRDASSADYSAIYQEQSFANVPPPYEQVYATSSSRQQNVYEQYAQVAGPSNLPTHTPEQNSYSYYTPSTNHDYMTPQQTEFDASIAGRQIYNNGLGINSVVTSMDPPHQELGHSIPNTPQNHRYSISSDSSYPVHQNGGNAHPVNTAQNFDHSQPQHHQMSTPDPSSLWPDGSPYNSLGGYGYWKAG